MTYVFDITWTPSRRLSVPERICQLSAYQQRTWLYEESLAAASAAQDRRAAHPILPVWDWVADYAANSPFASAYSGLFPAAMAWRRRRHGACNHGTCCSTRGALGTSRCETRLLHGWHESPKPMPASTLASQI